MGTRNALALVWSLLILGYYHEAFLSVGVENLVVVGVVMVVVLMVVVVMVVVGIILVGRPYWLY